MRVFISGLISNGETCSAEETEKNITIGIRISIQLQLKGYSVVSPYLLQIWWRQAGLTYDEIMALCFSGVLLADILYMIPGWEQSAGSQREHKLAKSVGKRIVYDIAEL